MKNILRILPFLLILTLSSCDFLKNDFLRKLAGRPLAAEVEAMGETRMALKRAVADSLERLRQETIAEENARADSVAAAGLLGDMGIQISGISRFGRPVEAVPYRYNAIVGVFRRKATAGQLFTALSAKGYDPHFIFFGQQVRAVCLCGSDTLSCVAGTLSSARRAHDCPKGTWVYVAR